MIYTSRSAVEAYQECHFYRYNQNFRLGKGIVAKQRSVPLVTGGAVHRGVEHLLNRVRIGQEPDVETAVGLALEQYKKDVSDAGFSGKDLQNDRQQYFTFNEQKALAEGLIRSWDYVELPNIRRDYDVLAVEREIEPIEIAPGVMFMAKVDGEFKDKGNGGYVNYSLKTAASWGDRMEDSYKSDLQGITEIWSVEVDATRDNASLRMAIEAVKKKNEKAPKKAYMDIIKYLEGQIVDKQVGAIRFCFLIKGQWKFESREENALKKTESPLVRGYKNVTPGGIAYAHSWYYPNPENKSGQGALGKGWSRFNVWEEMGVKSWFEMIKDSQVQPECGDVIKNQVITPPEYFRDEGEIKEGIEELINQEYRIKVAINNISGYHDNSETVEDILREVFPKNRKHCFFHYGSKCEYHDVCFKPEVTEDPIGSELYQIRVPHHSWERDAV